jgi:hypothetical protein
MLIRTFVVALLSMSPVVLAGTLDALKDAAPGLSAPLGSLLEGQLGVTSDQASGGLGAFLTLAQERLQAGDFDKIASLVPGASGYMDTAKKLGAVTGPLENVGGLNAALGKLGMSTETVQEFVPTVSDYLGKAGGSEVQRLLGSVLKP